jgi:hypothetical protein
MKKHIRKQGVRSNDALIHSRKNRRHRCCILRGVKFPLVFNRFLDALVLFHANCLDPGHAPSLHIDFAAHRWAKALFSQTSHRKKMVAGCCAGIRPRVLWGASTSPNFGKVGSNVFVTRVIASRGGTGNNAKRLECSLFCNSFAFNDLVGSSGSQILVLFAPPAGPIHRQPLNLFALPDSKRHRQFGL